MPGLDNDAHERFCEEYLKDLNATQAYMRAYPDASYDTGRANGSALLANTEVAERVAELKAERAARVHIELDDVLRELAIIAFSDPADFPIDDLGHFVEGANIDPARRRAISGVKHRISSNGEFTTHEIEVKLWNKNDALKQLADHLRNPIPRRSEDDLDEDGVFPLALIRKAVKKAEARRKMLAPAPEQRERGGHAEVESVLGDAKP